METTLPQATVEASVVKLPPGSELPPSLGAVGNRPALPELARMLAYASWRRHLRAWRARESSQWLTQYAYVEQITPHVSLMTIHLRSCEQTTTDRSRWCLRLFLHAQSAQPAVAKTTSTPHIPIRPELAACANERGTLLYYATHAHSLFPDEEIGMRDGAYLDEVYALLLPYQPHPLEVRLAQGGVTPTEMPGAGSQITLTTQQRESAGYRAVSLPANGSITSGDRTIRKTPPPEPIREQERRFAYVRGLRDRAYVDLNAIGERLVTLRTQLDSTPTAELLRAIEDRKITRAEEWAAAVNPRSLPAQDWVKLREALTTSVQAKARYEALAEVCQYICETLPDGHPYIEVGGRLKCERCGFEQMGQDPSLYEADSFLR